MKFFLVMGLFIISSSAFSAVYKSYDSKQSCNLLRVDNESKALENEEVVTLKNIYGFSFENMEVNFDKREARVQVIMNVTLGFNQALFKKKSSIASDNSNFTNLINHLNRKINIFEEICVTESNQIIYANEFKTI